MAEKGVKLGMQTAGRVLSATLKVEEMGATGSDQRRHRLTSAAATKQMFHTSKSGATTVRIRPGLWQRNHIWNGTSHDWDTDWDPVAESGASASATFTGKVYAYAVLQHGSGKNEAAWDPTDLVYTSIDWVVPGAGFAQGVAIYFITEKVWRQTGVDVQHQLTFLAEITYAAGAITRIVQAHQGPIIDWDPLNKGGKPAGSDPEAYHLDFYYAPSSAALGIGLDVNGGSWYSPHAAVVKTHSSTTFTPANVASGEDVYATILPDETIVSSTIAEDPSLVPDDLRVLMDGGDYDASKWYGTRKADGQKLLYMNQGVLSYGINAFPVARGLVGDTDMDIEFYMRPDGVDVGIAILDTDYPRVRSMDYVTNGVHKGELQDFQAYEEMVAGSTITNNDDDLAIPYYHYNTAGTVDKKFARMDEHDYSQWLSTSDGGRSIEVIDDGGGNARQQVHNMHANVADLSPSGVSGSGTDPDEYLMMVKVRDSLGNYNEIQYADISDLINPNDWSDDNYREINANIRHNELDYESNLEDVRIEAEENIDQDFRYAVLGSDNTAWTTGYGSYFDKIGYGTSRLASLIADPVLRHDLGLCQLFGDGDEINPNIDYDAKFLKDAGVERASWASGAGQLIGDNGEVFDFDNHLGEDSNLVTSFDYELRKLYVDDAGAPVEVFDWVAMLAYDYTTGTESADFINRIFTDSNGDPSHNYDLRTLINTLGVDVVDYLTYNLYDESGVQSWEWNSRLGYDSVGDNSMDYSNRTLSVGVSSTTVLDWAIKRLYGDWVNEGDFTVESGDYWHEGRQGTDMMDGSDYVTSGGAWINESGLEMHTVNMVIPGTGNVSMRIPGRIL